MNLDQIPEFEKKDLKWGSCRLRIIPKGEARTLTEAWALLPRAGDGTVVLAGSITRFEAASRDGLLVEADVAESDRSTLILRMVGPLWRAWLWEEGEGEEHRYVEHAFLSSRKNAGENELLVYRQYWKRQPDREIQVWRPIGARFVGFEGSSR